MIKYIFGLLVLFITFLLLSGCRGGGSSGGVEVSVKPSLLIPLYSEPENWGTLVEQKRANFRLRMVAIVNQANGDFTQPSANYEDGIEMLARNGIEPIGYVYSSYGKRSMDAIKENIDMWSNYNIGGIFIDEVDDNETFAYYKELSDYIRSKGLKVIMNPGSDIDGKFVALADIMVVVENYYSKLLTQRSISYSGAKAALIHASPSSDEVIDEALAFAKRHKCAYVYVTDDKMPNPWDAYPSYFDRLLVQMR